MHSLPSDESVPGRRLRVDNCCYRFQSSTAGTVSDNSSCSRVGETQVTVRIRECLATSGSPFHDSVSSIA